MQHHLHHGELVQVGVEQRLDDHAAGIVTFARMCGRYALHANPEVVALQFGLDARCRRSRRATTSRRRRDVLVVGEPQGVRCALGPARQGSHNLRAETVARSSRRSAPLPGAGERLLRMAPKVGRQAALLRASRRTSALFGFAGIWERRHLRHHHDGAERALRAIHHRMPVIVARRTMRAGWAATTACSRRRPTTRSPRTRSAPRSTAAQRSRRG